MHTPIDPAQITSEDIGEHVIQLEMGHEEAIEFVREVCLEEGFGVPVEFSPADLLAEKIDAERDPYYVLGACNPGMADRALDETPDIGALFPCNIIIREVEPGVQEVYHVSIMRVARLVGLAPDSTEWADIVAETGEMVAATYNRLQERAA